MLFMLTCQFACYKLSYFINHRNTNGGKADTVSEWCPLPAAAHKGWICCKEALGLQMGLGFPGPSQTH
jgi:hypothetical protein